MTSYRESTHRLLVLDVLRALAVLLVLGHHVFVPPTELAPLRGFLEGWQLGGWIGVDLFFVLSGFLISGLLFREHERHGTIRIGRFYLRRGFKLYPAFYLVLATTIGVRLYRGVEVPVTAVLSEAFFVQNYGPSLWGHTWSLAIEEHFYLVLPLLLLLLSRVRGARGRPYDSIPAIFLLVALLVLGLRFGTAYFSEYHTRSHFKPTHLRIDALMFGVFLSYLFHYREDRFRRLFRKRHFWPLMACGIGLWYPAFVFHLPETPYLHTAGMTALYLGSGLVLCALLVRGIPENRFTRAVAHVGSHSYSIYLWHLPVRAWLIHLGVGAAGLGLPPWVVWAAYMAGTVGLGILMAHLIEFPVLKLRDRLVPSRSRPLGRPGPDPGTASEEPVVTVRPAARKTAPPLPREIRAESGRTD